MPRNITSHWSNLLYRVSNSVRIHFSKLCSRFSTRVVFRWDIDTFAEVNYRMKRHLTGIFPSFDFLLNVFSALGHCFVSIRANVSALTLQFQASRFSIIRFAPQMCTQMQSQKYNDNSLSNLFAIFKQIKYVCNSKDQCLFWNIVTNLMRIFIAKILIV